MFGIFKRKKKPAIDFSPDAALFTKKGVVLRRRLDEDEDDTEYRWPYPDRWSSADTEKTVELEFARAYEIDRTDDNWLNGLENCRYSVRGREFVDLDFVRGEVIQKFDISKKDDIFQLRRYPDGKKFIFHTYTIPTFDAEDTHWDGQGVTAIFRDEAGVHLIHSRFGYAIPRISIFIELKTTGSDFDKWLKFLDD